MRMSREIHHYPALFDFGGPVIMVGYFSPVRFNSKAINLE